MLLIGAGPMAVEYAKVLSALKIQFCVVGRGKKSARRFLDLTGIEVSQKSINEYALSSDSHFSRAIVAVDVTQLGQVVKQLVDVGVKYILVEKPGALDFDELSKLNAYAKSFGAHVFIAYNRRFLESVKICRQMIAKDDGIKSFHFEFTEWSDSIGKMDKSKDILDQWLFANSSHVIDLAFYVGGEPKAISTYVGNHGGVKWFSRASSFSGAGVTKSGATFSYCANWDSPGRWSLEFMSKNYRFILSPMEELKIIKRNSIAVEKVEYISEPDSRFKPGLYEQVQAFLSGGSGLMTLSQQVDRLPLYRSIGEGVVFDCG